MNFVRRVKAIFTGLLGSLGRFRVSQPLERAATTNSDPNYPKHVCEIWSLRSEVTKNLDADFLRHAWDCGLWLDYPPEEPDSRFDFRDESIDGQSYTVLEVNSDAVWCAKSAEELRYLLDIYLSEGGAPSLIENWQLDYIECNSPINENDGLTLPESLPPNATYLQLNLYLPYFPVDSDAIIGWDEALMLLSSVDSAIVIDGKQFKIDHSESSVDLDDGAYEVDLYAFRVERDLADIYSCLRNIYLNSDAGSLSAPGQAGIKGLVPFPAGFPKLETGRFLSEINARLLCHFSLEDEDLEINFEFPIMTEDGESVFWSNYV